MDEHHSFFPSSLLNAGQDAGPTGGKPVMTNDNEKRDVRAYKQTYGVNHTTARRIVMAARRGRRGSRIEPPVELRLLHGHPWADLVLDARSVFQADDRLTGQLGTPLAAATLEVPSAGGAVRIAVHAHLPLTWKGSAVTTIAYPDGFSLAHVSIHLAEYGCTATDIERAYRRHRDVFRDLLFPTDSRATVSREHIVQRAVDAVARIRIHAQEKTDWFGIGAADPRAATGTMSSSDVETLWTGAAVGFSNAADAAEVFDWLPHDCVCDAVEAGFDLDDPAHRKWVTDSGRYWWPWCLDGGWKQVKALHDVGWSLRAVRELCSDHSANVRHGYREVVAFADTDGPGWVDLMGSPAEANRFLEKHVSLYRAQAQSKAGRPLDDLLADDIDINDALDWVDRYMAALKGVSDDEVMSAKTPIPLLVAAVHGAWEEPESAFVAGRFVEHEGSWYLVLHSAGGWVLTQVPGAVDAFDLPADDAFYGHGTRWPGMKLAERRAALLAWAAEGQVFSGVDAVLDDLRVRGQIGASFSIQTRVFASMVPYFTDADTRATIGRPRWQTLLRASEGADSRRILAAGDI